MSERQEKAAPAADFWLHMGLVLFIAAYFGAVFFWFARLFVTGGTEEHVVMSLVIPVLLVLGVVSVVGLLLIVLEGRRASRDKRQET
jgi:hypothetical protein